MKRGNLFNYVDDNSVSVNNEELDIVHRLLPSEAGVTFRWFCSNDMEANQVVKISRDSIKGNKQDSDFKVSVGRQNIEFSKLMTSLGIYIDEYSNFDFHKNIERHTADTIVS